MNPNPKVTIGIPVHNGERFLSKKINSILELGYDDFEIIISDNASIDKTREISESFLQKDKRIRYFYHEKNLGPMKNFEFILEKAIGEYFMWSAVDDIILAGFIEKNLEALQNKKIVCSASQVQYYGEKTDYIKQNENIGSHKIKNKIFQHFSPLQNIPASGKLSHKIRKYLTRRGHHHIFYGMFRTEQIKKNFVSKNFSGFDLATILNSLKYGDIHVAENVLMYRYDGGYSSKGFFNYKKSLGLNFFQALFHLIPFTNWFIKNFEFKIFLRNLDALILWNLESFFYLGIDLMRKIGIGKRDYN